MALLATALFASCQSDETFTADPRYTLNLSHDTVSVDTVLVSIKSTDREFRIYNPNKVGIRLTAQLAGGSNSSFSMNIDGRNSHSINDLEILPGDSLFGFINIQPRPADIQAGNPLTLLRDSILLTMESGNTCVIQLNATVRNAIFLKNHSITANTLFTAELPYVIYDTLHVASGTVLTINPGTTLLFHDGAGMSVQGTVKACGTRDSMVNFRTDRLDRLFSNLPYDLLSGQWNGIDLSRESSGNIFEFCNIHGAKHGIKADSTGTESMKFRLTNSIIHNIEGTAIQASDCRISVSNSQITNSKQYCIDLYGGIADFTFCTLANCYLWSGNSGGVIVSDHREDGAQQPAQATFNSCILTASGSWGLTADLTSTDPAVPEDGQSSCTVSNSLVLMQDTTTVISVNTIFEDITSGHYGAANFKARPENSYLSVFRLDSISAARGIAHIPSAAEWPVDLAGTARPLFQKADAGCYQFTEEQ